MFGQQDMISISNILTKALLDELLPNYLWEWTAGPLAPLIIIIIIINSDIFMHKMKKKIDNSDFFNIFFELCYKIKLTELKLEVKSFEYLF